MARLEHLIEHRTQYPEFLYAVLFFDLDHFKALNDSRGHLVGDELLQQVSQRLSACLRPTDTITRFGGDEFVILLEDLETPDAAIAMAQQIQAELTHPFQLREEEAFTSASIGITFSTENYQRPEDILRDADAAMYHAKHSGKRRFKVFAPTMQTRIKEQLQLENDLRRAIADQSLCLYYQPIFSLVQKQLVGLEALIRWEHPVKGLLQPDEFIPIAETTGLIDELEAWVFSTACWQLSRWKQQFPDNPDLMLSVNLSAAQLRDRDLLSHIDAVLAETGLPGQCLNFELTESCTLDLSADKAQLLTQLRSRGIRLCIDDFGVGYSSLSRLHDLPIDALKIDRSFIDNLGENTKSREIVATIVALSRCLNLDVIAEGIETTAQLDQLQDLNCTFGQGTLELGQGFLFSPPLTPMKITQFLKKSD